MVSFPERGWPERNGSPVRNLTGHFTMASVGVWKDSDLTWSPDSRESPHLDFFFPLKACYFQSLWLQANHLWSFFLLASADRTFP